MKKLEWNFISDIKPELIDHYLEPHSKNKNKWWSSLTNFMEFSKTHKEYIKKAAKQIFNGEKDDSYLDVRPTSKLCPAIGNGILDKTFLIKLPCDLAFSINSDLNYTWRTPDDFWQVDISSHPIKQFHSEKDNPFEGYMNIKIELPIWFKTNDVPCMYLQPQYHKQEYPFTVINGVVEGSATKGQPLNINTLIKIPQTEENSFLLKEGTVLAYLWFPENMKMVHNNQLKKSVKKTFVGERINDI